MRGVGGALTAPADGRADRIPQELRRIIEFLNLQMQPAEVLGVEITFFFEGDPNTRENNWKPLAEADPIFGFVGTAVGLELNQAFIAIKDDRVRRSIIKMTETLAKASAAPKD